MVARLMLIILAIVFEQFSELIVDLLGTAAERPWEGTDYVSVNTESGSWSGNRNGAGGS